MLSRRLNLRIGTTASIALAALSFSAASANAGVLVSSAPSCDGQPLSTPFQPWLDPMSYTPVPGGDFESSATGWTLSGGAAVADGNESFNVAGQGSKSLTIPSGGSATSPTMCVGLEHPTIRFFTKRNSGGLLDLPTMRVDVLFESSLGLVSSLPVVGVILPSNSWQTQVLPMIVVANLLPLLPGHYTPVRFRFTPLGGSWSVDDIYVDPYNRH